MHRTTRVTTGRATSRSRGRCRSAIVSSRRALYSTPSWFGTVSRSVSASRTAASSAQLRRDHVGLADVAAPEARERAVEVADLVVASRPARPPKYVRSRSVVIGMTLRLTETRGSCCQPAAPTRSRKSAICSACSSSNGTPVSSSQQRRAHQVHALLAPPTRRSRASRRPTRSGRTARATAAGSAARRRAGRPPVSARDDARAGDRRAEQRRSCARARSASVSSLARHVAERLGAAERGLGRAAADAELQPAAADEVGGGGLLGHVERVLVAHVDHGRADLDAARARADRREQRERRRELPREVVDADERAVDAELLGRDGELDRLHERLARRPRLRALRLLPVAEREEADALPRCVAHSAIEARKPDPAGRQPTQCLDKRE